MERMDWPRKIERTVIGNEDGNGERVFLVLLGNVTRCDTQDTYI